MRQRLNPFLTVVVRPPTLVQLGASATGAPVLQPPPWLAPDVTAGLLRWLQSYRSPRELQRRAADAGMTPGDVDDMLDVLRVHGLLQVEPPRSPLQVYLHGRGPVSDAVLVELAALDGVAVSAGTARGWSPSGRVVDLVLLTDFLSPDPVLVQRLMHERVPHVPVVLRDGAGVIGPLVLPGAGPCLRCLDRSRADADPGWPTLACQLFGRSGRASAQVLRVTAAVATMQVAAIAAGRWDASDPPDVLGCTLEVEGSAIAVRRWFMHPGCGCGVTDLAATEATF